MALNSVILTAFSVLFAIIGFLIVDKLKSIEKSLSDHMKELCAHRDVISDHATRITVLEQRYQH